MRVVVCDTGPILHLREVEAFWRLEKTGEVIAPAAVDVELEALMAGWARERPIWLRIVSPSEADSRQADELRAVGLGPGEAETLALARSTPVPGSSARCSGWRYTGPSAPRLAKSSLWISRSVLNEPRDALNRLTD